MFDTVALLVPVYFSFTCKTWLIYMWDMTHSYVGHDSFLILTIYSTPLRCLCQFPAVWKARDMTHWYLWNLSFACKTWLIHVRDMTHSYVGHDSNLIFTIYATFCAACARFERRVTWLTDICGISHSHVRHDSFMYGTWLIHTWDMTHSYAGHDSFIRGTWLIHIWATY